MSGEQASCGVAVHPATTVQRALTLVGDALRELEAGTPRELAVGLDIAAGAIARVYARHLTALDLGRAA